MKPGSFDVDTAKEYVGDSRMRNIEASAREHADIGRDAYKPPHGIYAKFTSYASEVSAQMDDMVYMAAFSKRLARNERKLCKVSS